MASAGKGIWIPIGASTKELNAALAEAGIQLSQFKKGAEESAGGLHELEKGLKTTQREMRGHDRMVNFYVKQWAELVPVAGAAKGALAGIAGAASEAAFSLSAGLTPLAAIILAFEVVKAGVAVFEYFHEQAGKTAEKLKKVSEEISKMVDAIEVLKNKRQGITEGDVETRKLEAALKLQQRLNDEKAAADANPGEMVGQGDDMVYVASKQEEIYKSTLEIVKERFGTEQEMNNFIKARTGLVEELRLAEQKAHDDTDTALAEQGMALNAKTETEKIQVAYIKEMNDVEKKYRDHVYDVNQYEEATNLALQKRAQAIDDLRIKTIELRNAQSGGATGFEDTERMTLTEADKRKLEEQQHKTDNARIIEETKQDELSGQFSGFETPGGLGENQKQKDPFKENLKQAREFSSEMYSMGDSISSMFDSIGGAIGGAMGDAMSIIGGLIMKAIQLAIAFAMVSAAQTPVVGWLMVAAAGVAVLAAVATAFAGVPGKRAGGSVSANNPYLVGEYGPELFIPDASGNITPNSGLGGGGGTTIYNVSTMDSQSFDDFLHRNRASVDRANRTLRREGRA
jgi:hypothetical protein